MNKKMNAITQIKQWGNSKAVRLPKDFAQLMNLDVGANIELKKINDKTIQLVILTKPLKKRRLSLTERISRTDINRLPTIKDWDELMPVGNEI